MIKLTYCDLHFVSGGCTTLFGDGSHVDACPHNTHHYHVIAHRCGYGDDIMAYCREHEFCRSFLAQELIGGPSPVLHMLAKGHSKPGCALAICEEAIVQIFQRFLRANERPIISDVDWDKLKQKALELLEGSK